MFVESFPEAIIENADKMNEKGGLKIPDDKATFRLTMRKIIFVLKTNRPWWKKFRVVFTETI